MRLIDADWAERKAKEIIDGYAWAIRMAVSNAPTVDAVPLDKLCEWLGNLGMLAPGYFDDEPCAGCELAPYWKNKKSDCWKHEIEKWMEGLNGNK